MDNPLCGVDTMPAPCTKPKPDTRHGTLQSHATLQQMQHRCLGLLHEAGLCRTTREGKGEALAEVDNLDTPL